MAKSKGQIEAEISEALKRPRLAFLLARDGAVLCRFGS
jgi:hypothetical protein